MDLGGQFELPASRARVWALLNDPVVLRECIPGCESLEGSTTSGYAARVRIGIGPVKATFSGRVELTDMVEPQSFRISGTGSGGVAGFASGGAFVRLDESEVGTRLTYEADAKIGGKLAQLGSRLIESTAGKLANQFFASLARRVCADSSEGER
ncbi:MAG: carbon monoxide dehydrogenase [Mesorhizobium sp.]|nr:MAG: carbon monoxide dehydrogenase [Mesorhizobium sp.]